MKNPFKSIKEFFSRVNVRAQKRRENKEMMRNLQAVAVVFETLNKFRNASMLYVDFKRNTVTIAQALAEQFIYDDRTWQKFLGDVHLWAVYQFSVAEYTKKFNEAKANAEAKAYKANPDLTEADRALAKMKAVAQMDMEYGGKQMQLPNLQFVVLGVADGAPIVVAKLINGRYETASVPD